MLKLPQPPSREARDTLSIPGNQAAAATGENPREALRWPTAGSGPSAHPQLHSEQVLVLDGLVSSRHTEATPGKHQCWELDQCMEGGSRGPSGAAAECRWSYRGRRGCKGRSEQLRSPLGLHLSQPKHPSHDSKYFRACCWIGAARASQQPGICRMAVPGHLYTRCPPVQPPRTSVCVPHPHWHFRGGQQCSGAPAAAALCCSFQVSVIDWVKGKKVGRITEGIFLVNFAQLQDHTTWRKIKPDLFEGNLRGYFSFCPTLVVVLHA